MAALITVVVMSHLTGKPARALSLLAVPDSYSKAHDRLLDVAKPGVLGNDVSLLGATATLTSGVSHGMLTFRSDGSFAYRPSVRYVGNDTFRYRAGGLLGSTATVTISVTNAAPVARADSYTWSGGTLRVAAPGVLANDSDANGDALTVELVGGGISGSLDLNPNGSFRFKPGGGFGSGGSFQYRVSDGLTWSGTAIVTLTTVAATSAPSPTPSPTPRPTPRPTPTPTPLPILPVPSLPLPSLPLPSLPLPSSSVLPLPIPSQPLPISSALPSLGSSASPAPSTQPNGADGSPSPSSGASSPGADGGQDGSAGGGTVGPGGGFRPGGPPNAAAAGEGLRLQYSDRRGLDLTANLGDLLGFLDIWAVPAATIGVSGLLVILFVALQAGGTVVWVPAMRRLRGERQVRRPRARR